MPTELEDVDLRCIYKKWQSFARQYDCFVHTTSFATLKNYPNFILNPISVQPDNQTETILKICGEHGDPHTLIFMDLPLEMALRQAYFCNRKFGLSPILTVRLLYHPYGLIGGKEDISALIGYADKMNSSADPPASGYVFVTDSRRYADFDDEIYKQKFNNQYELTDYDLPPLEMLEEYEVDKAVFLYETKMKEDLLEYKNYLEESQWKVFTYDTSANKEKANGQNI